MKRFLAPALVLALAPVLVASPAHAMTVDEIVSRNIAARGGADRMHAIQSIRATGKSRYGDGDFTLELTSAWLTTRSGRTRTEDSFQGLTGVDAYDGREAWRTEPWEGRRDPFRLSADETKRMAHEADIDGPLVDWQQKGNRVEYLGTENIDGSQAHKLRVTRKDGDWEITWLDPDAFLEIRAETHSFVRGVERVSVTDFGDYEQVAGVWMAFAFDSGPKGQPRHSHTRVERIEVNVPVDESLFAFPAQGTKVVRTLFAAAGVTPPPSAQAPAAPASPRVFDSDTVSGLGARNIGSATMSGRISAVAAHNVNGKTTLYVGAASGGVWKSTDGGTTFKPIFDKQSVQSIGAITVDPWNWKNIWVGTGEAWTRNSASIGDGIYRSTDAGETWTHVGLPESERVARILVRPHESDVVYACVPGKLWSDSADRGVYKTTDGGKNWSLVLRGGNLSTGCSSLTMDPKNPDVLFAGMWDFRRKGWTFRSGGDGPTAPSGSGLYRSTDGGTTWTPMTSSSNAGLPAGPWGRVEVTVAPSDPRVVYAFIESTKSALFRSGDGGATWERRDDSQNMVWRPFYFARLVVDPVDPNRLFKPDLRLIVSEDGGRSFSDTSGGSHGDWHDVWIDPTNPAHVIGGDDGGLWISWDRGSKWWKVNNLPVSQFYHVSVDAKDPYQVYGGLQDNSSWVGDSFYPGGISNQRWENLYGGDGFWAMVDPTDPDFVYAESQGGYIGRVNRRTHAARDIQPKALFKEKLRFNWNTPIAASPTVKGTVYLGGQFLFRSRDHGDTWERISPDLTTNDKEKQKQEQSGGVTVDNSSAEMHTTVYSISESPKNPQLVWVGTDDGNLQLTRDGGRTWTNVAGNVPGLPPNSWVSWVEASRWDAGTALATFDRHTFGDMTPWVYRTTDYGKTWTRIVGPDKGVRGYAHVIKEDTVDQQLYFLGTELGLWISIDAGQTWAQFRGGEFPAVAVRDLQVHPRDGDLVLATHGRGIWIIDDLTPLRSITPEVLAKTATFLPSRPVQQRMPASGGWPDGDAVFVGQNAARGATIDYYQRTRHLFGKLKLEVLDDKGKLVDTVDTTTRRGINRVTWTMQVRPPKVPRAAQAAFNSTQGPRVVPGRYTLRLTKGDQTIETKLDIGLDHRAPFTVADRRAQFDAAIKVRALFDDMSGITDRLDAAHRAIEARLQALPQGDAVASKLQALEKKLEDTKRKIVATKEGGAITGEERIREHLDILYGAFTGWEGRPTRYQLDRIDVLRRELTEVGKDFDAIVSNDVKPLDDELKRRKLDPIPTTAEAHAERDEPMDAQDAPVVNAVVQCVQSHGAVCDDAARAVRQVRARQGEKD
jgi:photosystem II stability/assembly factor-like uncharacterized protein